MIAAMRLHAIEAPGTTFAGRTLFLRGELSSFVLPEHEAAIRRFFPHAEVATLQGAGHWLHADRPEDFSAIVRDFARGEDEGFGPPSCPPSGPPSDPPPA